MDNEELYEHVSGCRFDSSEDRLERRLAVDQQACLVPGGERHLRQLVEHEIARGCRLWQ